MIFTYSGADIYVERPGEEKELTIRVVGGSIFKTGLASEICDVLNKHYSSK